MVSAAWRIECEYPNATFKGACIYPHHGKGEFNAYRGEMMGIMEGLKGLLSIFLRYDTYKVFVKLGCDRSSALIVYQDY